MKNNNLKTYRSKRNFEETPEPTGKPSQSSGQALFVVQKHAASHLHYDFRLEIDGVLKSWAVPKGPPLEIGQKRLAIETEDHPLEYAHFQGIIPPGNYGAGTVQIWDEGNFTMLKDIPADKAYQEGHLELLLYGKKLVGPYALIRTKLSKTNKPAWLLFKMKG